MKLNELRRRIDRLDAGIVRLLNRRAKMAVAVGGEKRRVNAAIYDPARERRVVAKVLGLNRGPISRKGMRSIYARIIAECLDLQKKPGK